MTGSRPQPPFEVVLDERDWDSLRKLPRESQQNDAFEFLWGHASHTPTVRIPGKLKRLKGEHSDLYQYDIDREYRILYTVDVAAKRVEVQYIGYHPDWGRRSSSRRRIRR
jgi:Txe/YoeB family toxin of Txe-Axe toxin-antitoxin module